MSTQGNGRRVEAEWSRLVLDDWTDTRQTLRMWTRSLAAVQRRLGSAAASGSGVRQVVASPAATPADAPWLRVARAESLTDQEE
jgi:hypothetical protein